MDSWQKQRGLFRQFICHCKGCGKRLRDPEDNPIYLVRDNEYWCSQPCMNRNDPTRKEAIENAREAALEEAIENAREC